MSWRVVFRIPDFSSWWFQPLSKNISISQNGNLPQRGMNIKNIWNHHLVFVGAHELMKLLRQNSCKLPWAPQSWMLCLFFCPPSSPRLRGLERKTRQTRRNATPKGDLGEVLMLRVSSWKCLKRTATGRPLFRVDLVDLRSLRPIGPSRTASWVNRRNSQIFVGTKNVFIFPNVPE